MNNKEIVKKLKKADKKYYLGEDPIMSDDAYDELKDNLRKKTPNHPYFKQVGSDPKYKQSIWETKKHKKIMGSQRKASSIEELKEKFSPFKNQTLMVQEKLDGFSLEINYKNGKVVSAITRGDGKKGEDVLRNVKKAKGFLKEINKKEEISLYCECIITLSDFEILKGKYREQGKKEPSNPRNSASGIIHRKDGKYCRLLTLKYFDVYSPNIHFRTEEEKINFLKSLKSEDYYQTVGGFTYFVVNGKKFNKLKEIKEFYKYYQNTKRENLNYWIDGFVIKINDLEEQQKFGMKNNRPQGQIALKFPSESATTKLVDVKWTTSRNGRINPIAILDPVELDGTIVKKASLHNYKVIDELNLTYGCEVIIEKKGDIIPQIVLKNEDKSGKKIQKPRRCPCCGEKVTLGNTYIWCNNIDCKSRNLKRLINYFKVLNIENIGKSFVEKLYEKNIVNHIEDFYEVKRSDLEGLEGIGEKTINLYFNELEKSLNITPQKFLQSLGIHNLSEATSKLLVENFSCLDSILYANIDKLIEIKGIGEKTVKQIKEGFRKNKKTIKELRKYLNIVKEEKKSNALKGKTFCITGSLNGGTKKDYKEKIKNNGGEYKSGVIKNLSYLITANKNSTSNKMKKAKEYNISIITEKEFNDILKNTI